MPLADWLAAAGAAIGVAELRRGRRRPGPVAVRPIIELLGMAMVSQGSATMPAS